MIKKLKKDLSKRLPKFTATPRVNVGVARCIERWTNAHVQRKVEKSHERYLHSTQDDAHSGRREPSVHVHGHDDNQRLQNLVLLLCDDSG